MCRVRAKILVARKLGREQKRERSGEGVGQGGNACKFEVFRLLKNILKPNDAVV